MANFTRGKKVKKSFGNVYAVIVTYANRSLWSIELADLLLFRGISKVIIVDNNSENESAENLSEYVRRNSSKVYSIRFSENIGTASAFKAGLKKAHSDKKCDFIWVFDDDIIPRGKALVELEKTWSRLVRDTPRQKLMILSWRSGKFIYRKAVLEGKPEIVFGRKNYFRVFHFKRFINIFKINKYVYYKKKKEGEVFAGPYGGMFFHKDLLDWNGYPDKRFYIYGDDYDFSYRLVKKGGKIVLSLKSVLDDIERSWTSKGFGPMNIVSFKSKALLYYSIRNRVILEMENTVENKIIYFVNALIYSGLILIASLMKLKITNYSIFIIAVYDGMRGKTGIHQKYRI
jgi:GT2 family glycosyltransferase